MTVILDGKHAMAVHKDTGTMSAPTPYQSQTLNHLGLVAGMIDELGWVDQIDQLLPKAPGPSVVSCGQAVKAMILNGLGFSQRTLYLSRLFFEDKPVHRLIGEGISADQLDDNLLGRTLDRIYAKGLESFYGPLSLQALRVLGLNGRFGHLDSSSFHVDGRYNSESAPDEESNLIHITRGYSRDHRPDLNQVVVQLICEHQAGIPLLMKPLGGNSNDKTDFRATVEAHVEQLQQATGLEYLVADSALYTAKTLALLESINWISRVPETISLARQVIQTHAQEVMADLTQTGLKAMEHTYADVRQRWLLVYSPAAYQRALKTVPRQLLKQGEQETRRFQKLCRQPFACETDARQAVADWQKKQIVTELTDITYSVKPTFSQPGRPKKGTPPDGHQVYIQGTLSTTYEVYQQRLARKSCFIIATNVLDSDSLTEEDLLRHYKEQQTVERGFRFLKDPRFMASTLFLKSVERVMALTVVMTLCLVVYAALEYRIRQALAQTDETFPDQKGKPTQRPTARWVFQYFGGIHLLILGQTQEVVLNLKHEQQTLIKLLGKPYAQIYS